MSGLEYGCGGFITSFGGSASLKNNELTGSGSNVIQGYATRFRRAHQHKGNVEIFMPGAFARTLAVKSLVRFCLDHRQDLLLGTTADRLDLAGDDDALIFRLKVPASDLGAEATESIKAGARTQMSVGYEIVDGEWKTIEGCNVRIIRDALLNEVSLVKTAAVPGTFAYLTDASNTRLTEISKHSLAAEYASANLSLQLKAMTTKLASILGTTA